MAWGISNIGAGGGSLQPTDAILRIQAPAGSIVTITKGNISKHDSGHENALDHNVYDYYFIIHQSQFDNTPWNIVATDGDNRKEQTLIINESDEYDVVFVYDLYVIKNGEFIKTFTKSGGTLNNGTYAGVYCAGLNTGGNAVRVAYTSEKIDITYYSTLYIKAYRVLSWNGTGVPAIGICAGIPATPGNDRVTGYTALTKTGTNFTGLQEYSVDISSYTGEYYIAFSTSGTSSWSGLFYSSDYYLVQ